MNVIPILLTKKITTLAKNIASCKNSVKIISLELSRSVLRSEVCEAFLLQKYLAVIKSYPFFFNLNKGQGCHLKGLTFLFVSSNWRKDLFFTFFVLLVYSRSKLNLFVLGEGPPINHVETFILVVWWYHFVTISYTSSFIEFEGKISNMNMYENFYCFDWYQVTNVNVI